MSDDVFALQSRGIAGHVCKPACPHHRGKTCEHPLAAYWDNELHQDELCYLGIWLEIGVAACDDAPLEVVYKHFTLAAWRAYWELVWRSQ